TRSPSSPLSLHDALPISPRARPADCSFFMGALAALAAAAGNVVAKPLLERRLENADGTAACLAAARPGSLGLASAGALPGGGPQIGRAHVCTPVTRSSCM